METLMTILAVMCCLAVPVLIVVFVVRWICKKTKKWIGLSLIFCVTGVITFSLIASKVHLANLTPSERTAYEEMVKQQTEEWQIEKTAKEKAKSAEKAKHEAEKEAERLAKEQKKADKAAADLAKKEFLAAEKAEREAKKEAERLAKEREKADKVAAERARKELLAAEKRQEEEEKLAAKQRMVNQQLEAERKAAEEAAEQEKLAREEADRLEQERLAVTFEEIYTAYKENELRADDKYQYNRYRITAKINGMTSHGLFNLSGGAILTMETRVKRTIVFFYAEFEKEQEELLKNVNVGDTITFEGECLSAGTWIDCELIVE